MMENRPLPEGWRWARLGDVCKLNPRRPPDLSPADGELVTFVPMQAVDEMQGRIAWPEVRTFCDVRKGYTYFAENDVLFAKITPCMQNGKHAIASALLGGFGFGTTEFHVLRPSPEITPEWIHFFIRQPEVLENAKAYFTGAVGQQRVPETYLASLEVPWPPLAEQKRIAAILNEQMAAVERARAAAEAQLEAAKALPAASLRAVFESPEARQWPRKRLGEVALLVQNGIYKTADNYGHGHPFLRMYNIRNRSWRLRLEPTAKVALHGSESATFGLKTGDLLVSRVNSYELVGKCAWVGPEAEGYVFENMLIRVRLDQRVNPLFVAQQFATRGVRDQVESVAKRAIGQASINSEDVRGVRLLLPELAEQLRFAEMLNEQMASTQRTSETIEIELEAINSLPAALLRRAFSGEL